MDDMTHPYLTARQRYIGARGALVFALLVLFGSVGVWFFALTYILKLILR